MPMPNADGFRDAYGRFVKGRKFPFEFDRKRLFNSNLAHTIKTNLSSTPPLSYILGVVLGDGNCDYSCGHYRVRLKVVNKEFAKEFARNLNQLGLRANIYLEQQSPKALGTRPLWVAYAYSKRFYEWFSKLTYEHMRKILLNRENMKSFVKGFYESEGYCGSYKTYLRLEFSNMRNELLSFMNELMLKLGYTPVLRATKERGFVLSMYKQAEIKKFLKEINPCIKRAD